MPGDCALIWLALPHPKNLARDFICCFAVCVFLFAPMRPRRVAHSSPFVPMLALHSPATFETSLSRAQKSDTASKAFWFYYWITLRQTQSSHLFPLRRKASNHSWFFFLLFFLSRFSLLTEGQSSRNRPSSASLLTWLIYNVYLDGKRGAGGLYFTGVMAGKTNENVAFKLRPLDGSVTNWPHRLSRSRIGRFWIWLKKGSASNFSLEGRPLSKLWDLSRQDMWNISHIPFGFVRLRKNNIKMCFSGPILNLPSLSRTPATLSCRSRVPFWRSTCRTSFRDRSSRRSATVAEVASPFINTFLISVSVFRGGKKCPVAIIGFIATIIWQEPFRVDGWPY